MNSTNQVKAIVADLISKGATKSEILIKGAEARMGWPYAWGTCKKPCTVANRNAAMKNSKISQGDIDLIKKHCAILSGKQSACPGCMYYPNNELVNMNDCIGFIRDVFGDVGLPMSSGCTTAWNNSKLWKIQGVIKDMPDGVCCVFKQKWNKEKQKYVMEHIGLHVGGGRIIHCSVEVKEGKTTDSGWTHYAVPAGLDGDTPMPTFPTLKRGDRGEYVTLLQTKLIQQGYDVGSKGADGIFGANTEAAVKQFQRDHGLEADGICGKRTWEAINEGTATTYRVTIEHLARSVADEIVQKYGGTMTIEG